MIIKWLQIIDLWLQITNIVHNYLICDIIIWLMIIIIVIFNNKLFKNHFKIINYCPTLDWLNNIILKFLMMFAIPSIKKYLNSYIESWKIYDVIDAKLKLTFYNCLLLMWSIKNYVH